MSLDFIDLRSDTVTLPTAAMREAMATAELGDDVFGEDPTVNRLQERAAALLGKEAGLLVTSGTQGNLASVLAQTHSGEEALVEARAHIYENEAGGISRIAGLSVRLLPGTYGALTGSQVEAALRPPNVHWPRSSLLCLENTHNSAGGTILSAAQVHEVAAVAHEHGLRVHVDGARIFNAAIGLDVPPARLAEDADSLTFCLSKGLACPAGSVVVGSAEFIEEARRARKVLGGGMRQAGVLAAAGLIALDTMIDRLQEDHLTARRLAEGVATLEGAQLDLKSVQTNIVIFDVGRVGTALEVAASLRKQGLGVTTKGRTRLRCVTHHGIGFDQVERALEILESVLSP